MPVSLSADGASLAQEATERARKAHVNNPKALDGGLYFHVRKIDYETDKACCFPKAKGGGLWLPKSKIHVVKICLGRVDVWVEENFVRKKDKPYGEVLGPDVPSESLPEPSEELGSLTVITEDPVAKAQGHKFTCTREFHETDDALGLPTTIKTEDFVWIPKSQCHAAECGGKVQDGELEIWVKSWLVDKKRGLHSLKQSS